MAEAERIEYRRIPGRARRQSGLSAVTYRLWMADDHLLHVRDSGYSEAYRRFYFRDIQALTICATSRGRWINIIFASIAIVCLTFPGLVLYYVGLHIPGLIMTSIPSLFFSAAILGNTLRGPTSKFRLYTAVQAEELPSLDRLRAARKAFPMIQAAVESVQGAVPREQAGPGVAAITDEPEESPVELRHTRATIHGVVFALLAGGIAWAVLDMFFAHQVLEIFSLLEMLALLSCTVAAMIHQVDSTIPKSLQRFTWYLFGFLVLSFIVGTGIGMGIAFSDPEALFNPTLSAYSGANHPVVFGYDAVMAVSGTVLLVMGLGMWLRYRHALSREVAPSPDENSQE